MALVAGEFGKKKLRINTSYDLSAATALLLSLTLPDKTQVTRTPTLGTVDVVTPVGTFKANEYVEYVLASGDLPVAGNYLAQLQADFAQGTLKTVAARMVVAPG